MAIVFYPETLKFRFYNHRLCETLIKYSNFAFTSKNFVWMVASVWCDFFFFNFTGSSQRRNSSMLDSDDSDSVSSSATVRSDNVIVSGEEVQLDKESLLDQCLDALYEKRYLILLPFIVCAKNKWNLNDVKFADLNLAIN